MCVLQDEAHRTKPTGRSPHDGEIAFECEGLTAVTEQPPDTPLQPTSSGQELS